MRLPVKVLALSMVVAFSLCGCSRDKSDPLTPPNSADNTAPITQAVHASTPNHFLWGYYLISIDSGDFSAEVLPVRIGTIHLNVLQFLEQSPCTNCFRLAGISPNPDGTLNVNVTIEHPFQNKNLTGFDVRGVAMFNGSHEYPELGVVTSDRNLGVGEILNADGYTSLYNPTTAGHAFEGYIKGKFATASAPTATLNAFKRYVTDDPSNTRNAFFAGDEITSTFVIDMPDPPNPWLFGYAVDASWAPPIKKPVENPMTDFGPGANCPEPWKIDIVSDRVFVDGKTQLIIDVYDWQGRLTHNQPLIESPELFPEGVWASYMSEGPGYTRYQAVILNDLGGYTDNYRILVSVEAKENETSPEWMELSSYQMHIVEGGRLIWAKRAGGLGPDAGYGVTSLTDNSIGVTGIFSGAAVFGEGEANRTELTAVGTYDIFVARYNSDGTLAWASRAGGEETDGGYTDIGWAVTTLSDNSIVVTGEFQGSARFGEGGPNETLLASAGSGDIFIAKYRSDGTFEWAKRAGGIGKDTGKDIATLSDDSVVVAGSFSGTAVFGEGEENSTILTKTNDNSIFLARYSSDGMLMWAKLVGGHGWLGIGITTLTDDSIGLTGDFSWSALFGEGEPNETFLLGYGDDDIFVARYNSDGTVRWVRRAGGWGRDLVACVSVLSDDSMVITGDYSTSALFGEGELNETILETFGYDYYHTIFVARYLPDGSLAWAKRAGGYNVNSLGRGVSTLSDNSAIVTGIFSGRTLFGDGERNQTTFNGSSGFIASYNPDGTLSWAKRVGAIPYNITSLSDNTSVTTGMFYELARFGEGGPNETVLISAGMADIFTARYSK